MKKSISQFLELSRKFLVWVLIGILACPPHLAYANGTRSEIMMLGEEQLQRARVVSLSKEIPVSPIYSEIKVLPVTKGTHGVYPISFCPSLFKGEDNLFLVDGGKPVAILGIKEKEVNFHGLESHSFLVEGALDLLSLKASVGGSIAFAGEVSVRELAGIEAKKIKFASDFCSKDLTLGGFDNLTFKGKITSGNISLSGESFRNKGTLASTGNLLLNVGKLNNLARITVQKDTSITARDIINEEGASFHSGNFPQFLSETVINRGDIFSEADIQGLVSKSFDHYGSLRIKRNYILGGMPGNEKKKEKPGLNYRNHKDSVTFIGFLHQLNTGIYEDSGITYSATLSLINGLGCSFRDSCQYLCKRGVISTVHDLVLEPGSRIEGLHLLGLYSGRDLNIRQQGFTRARVQVNNALAFPYSACFIDHTKSREEKEEARKQVLLQKNLQRQFDYPLQDESLRGMLCKKPELLASAKRNLFQHGDVSSNASSINYQSGGKYSHKGTTNSGSFSWNHTHVTAQSALTSGYMKSWNDMSFNIEGNFQANGHINAKNLLIQTGSFQHEGHTTGNGTASIHASGQTRNTGSIHATSLDLKATSFENFSDLRALENLRMEILGPLYNTGSIEGNTINLAATKLDNCDSIKANQGLQVKADRLHNSGKIDGGRSTHYQVNYDFINAGYLAGESTSITAGAFVNLGNLYAPANLAISSLCALNMGWIRSSSVSVNSLLSANTGLYVPSLPARWQDILSFPYLKTGAKMALMNLHPYIRSVSNLGSSVIGLYHSIPLFCDRAMQIYRASRDGGASALELVDFIPLAVDAKDLGNSLVMTQNTAKANRDNLWDSGNIPSLNPDFWQTIPGEIMTFLGPRYSHDSLMDFNAGAVFSQTIYQRGILNHNFGIKGAAQSLTQDNIWGFNSGLMMGSDVSVAGSSFTNSGIIAANNTLQNNTLLLGNDGILSGSTINLNFDKFTNSGTVEGEKIQPTGQNMVNSGRMSAKDWLNADVKVLDNTGILHAEKRLEAKSDQITNSGTMESTSETVLNFDKFTNSGTVEGEKIEPTGQNMVNSGRMSAKDWLNADVKVLDNTGTLHAEKRLEVKSDQITNSGTLESTNETVLNFDKFTNSGSVEGNKVQAKGQIITNSGKVNGKEWFNADVNELDMSGGSIAAEKSWIKANILKRAQGNQFSGKNLYFEIGKYEDGVESAIHLADSCHGVEKVGLKMASENFTNDKQRHFHHEDLDLTFKVVENKADMTSSGNLALHGSESFTNHAGKKIQANGKLQTSTDGKYLNYGMLKAETGDNIQVGHTIESYATGAGNGCNVPVSEAGGNLVQEAKAGITHHGSKLRAEGTALLRTEAGDVNLNPYDSGKNGSYNVVEINAGKDIFVITPDRINARAAQFKANSDIVLKGDKGIDLNARSATHRGPEEHRTHGFGGFNQTSEYSDRADFHRANVQAGGNIIMKSTNGGIAARGARMEGSRIDIEAQGDIDMMAQKETVYSKKTETSLFGLKKKTTYEAREEAAVFEAKASTSVRIVSKGKLRGEGGGIVAPEQEIYGEKGTKWNELKLNYKKEVEKSGFQINAFGIDLLDPFEGKPMISPTLTLGIKKSNTCQEERRVQNALIMAKQAKIGTGKDAEVDSRGTTWVGYGSTPENIKKIDKLVVDTKKFYIGGSTSESSSSHSFKNINGGVGFAGTTLVPTGTYSTGSSKSKTEAIHGAQFHISHFENMREGLVLSASNGIKGGIDSGDGKKFSVLVDHAQTTESWESSHEAIGFSGDSVSLGLGKNWGEKKTSGHTDFVINNAPNMTERKDIHHEDKDTKGGYSINASLSSDLSKTNIGGSFQTGDHNFIADTRMIRAFTDTVPSSGDQSIMSILSVCNEKMGKTLDAANAVTAMATNINSLAGLGGADTKNTRAFLNKISSEIDNANYVVGNIRGIFQTGDMLQALKNSFDQDSMVKPYQGHGFTLDKTGSESAQNNLTGKSPSSEEKGQETSEETRIPDLKRKDAAEPPQTNQHAKAASEEVAKTTRKQASGKNSSPNRRKKPSASESRKPGNNSKPRKQHTSPEGRGNPEHDPMQEPGKTRGTSQENITANTQHPTKQETLEDQGERPVKNPFLLIPQSVRNYMDEHPEITDTVIEVAKMVVTTAAEGALCLHPVPCAGVRIFNAVNAVRDADLTTIEGIAGTLFTAATGASAKPLGKIKDIHVPSAMGLDKKRNMDALDIASSKGTSPGKAFARGTESKTGKELLPGEGKVGTYGDLKKLGKPGDNLTPHHVPQAALMQKYGVDPNKGIAINIEQPAPGKGGRHRRTRTYGRKPDPNAKPRDELARDVLDLRRIYKEDGLYTPEISNKLRNVIGMNKKIHPEQFKKQ